MWSECKSAFRCDDDGNLEVFETGDNGVLLLSAADASAYGYICDMGGELVALDSSPEACRPSCLAIKALSSEGLLS